MLTDLLAYTRIGHTEEAYAEVDTRALMVAIVKSLPRPEGFSVDLAGDWPVMEVIEPALDLVVRNLLDNAIKHHDRPNGRVVIAAQSWPRGLEISVADDGPGIAPEHHAAVFQPFLKLASGATPETSGSGIGLSLVRKAAETAGAVLTLESDPGARRGTTFRLRWPGRIVT